MDKHLLEQHLIHFYQTMSHFLSEQESNTQNSEYERTVFCALAQEVLSLLEKTQDALFQAPDPEAVHFAIFELNEKIAYFYCHNPFVKKEHQRHFDTFFESKFIRIIDEHSPHFGIPTLKQFKKSSQGLLQRRPSSLQKIDKALGEYELKLHTLRDSEGDTYDVSGRIDALKELNRAIEDWLEAHPTTLPEYSSILGLQKSSETLLNFLKHKS